MTPARLQSFLAIVDGGSARAAAAQLHVTESAVSASLAALQQELGVVLFERHGRGLRLTESGGIFAAYARQILGLLDEGAVAARSAVAPEAGTLRLGSVTTAGEYLLPGLLASFRSTCPDVEVTLEVGVRDHILHRLADHHLDVVVAGRPLPGRGLVSRATRANSLILVASPRHPWELADTTWLLREPGSGTRATALALIESLGIDPPTLSLGSHGAVIASAVLGLGVTLTSADAVARQLAEGALEELPARGTPLARPWHLLTTANPTATTSLFVEHAVTGVGSNLAFEWPRRRRSRG
jgi:LysR family transcriptional regulator, low CO2-responsive transcriptional regulator